MSTSKAQVSTFEDLFTGDALQLLIANGGDLDKTFRTNATLPHDAWISIDNTVIKVAGERLNGIADLQAHGLIRPLTGGLGVLYDAWQTMSEGGDAEQSMSGVTAGAENAVDFNEVQVPLPVTFVQFRINARKLLASARNGTPFDTYMIAEATKKVIEKLEDMLFNGSSVVFGGHDLPGYLNYTDSNEVALTGGWVTTPANIEKDIVKLINANEADRHYGPYNLYLHTDEWGALRQRDSTAGGINYLNILKGMAGINDVKPSDALGNGNLCLVEMTSGVVDLSTAVDLKVIQWPTHGGMSTDFMVMAVTSPRIKSDDAGRCGIAFDNNMA